MFSTSHACKVDTKGGGTTDFASSQKLEPTPPAKTSATDTVQTDCSKYNAPEYFSYSEYSYYDIDRECVSMRIKQPEAPIVHR